MSYLHEQADKRLPSTGDCRNQVKLVYRTHQRMQHEQTLHPRNSAGTGAVAHPLSASSVEVIFETKQRIQRMRQRPKLCAASPMPTTSTPLALGSGGACKSPTRASPNARRTCEKPRHGWLLSPGLSTAISVNSTSSLHL